MSRFYTRVRDSMVVSNLKQANAKLAKLAAREWEHQSRIDLIQMLRSVGDATLARLYVKRELVADVTLNNLESPSSEFLQWVNHISETTLDDDSYGDEASNAADQVLTNAASLPALHIRTTNRVFERASEQFDREVHSSMTALSERFDEVESEVSDTINRIAEASMQFNDLVAQLETRVRDGVDQADSKSASLLEETRQSVNSLLMRVDDANERLGREITSIQEVFRESQNERDKEFHNDQGARVITFHQKVDPAVRDVESFRDQARSMLEEVAGASTAEHYVKQRDKQNAAANMWRYIGVGALVVLVLSAAWIFFDAGSTIQEFTVVWLAARTGLVGAIVVFATYALRQSAHHRRREEGMTRVANELQLLWPFMNRLPDGDRRDLLREITPLYFKGGVSAQDVASELGGEERAGGGVLGRFGRSAAE